MELNFISKTIREICEYEEIAAEELGTENGYTLKTRLAELLAVTSLSDMPLGMPMVSESRPTQCFIELSADCKLVCDVANKNVPRTTGTEKVDWKRVTRLKITSIELGHATIK